MPRCARQQKPVLHFRIRLGTCWLGKQQTTMTTMNIQAVLVLACACVAAAAPPPVMRDSPADMGTMRALPSFSKIAANVPFNVLVMPGMHSVKVNAEKSVSDALQANVTDGVLTLTTNASFTTSQPIKARALQTHVVPYFAGTMPAPQRLHLGFSTWKPARTTCMQPVGVLRSANPLACTGMQRILKRHVR